MTFVGTAAAHSMEAFAVSAFAARPRSSRPSALSSAPGPHGDQQALGRAAWAAGWAAEGRPADGRAAPALALAASGLAAALALGRARRGRAAVRKATARRAEGAMQPQLPDAGIAIMEKNDLKAKMKEEFDKEKWWRVLLHNDDIHTFEYVTGCLTRTVKHLTRRKAYNITWEAHSSGKATVACVWKSLAEQFCVNLQQLGLTVSIAPDSKFEGNKGGK